MSGYLQRLVARVSPAGEGSLKPFVRTTSPIAARDQRIGLGGFETAPPGGAPTSQEFEAPPHPVSSAWTPRFLHSGTDSHVPDRADPALPALAAPATGSAVTRDSAPGRVTPPGSGVPPAKVAAVRPKAEPESTPVRPRRAGTSQIVRAPSASASAQPADDGIDAEREAGGGRRRARALQGTKAGVAIDDSAPALLAPRVDRDPGEFAFQGPGRRDAAEDVDAPDGHSIGDGGRPRVEIGTIHVEVVPPTAPQENGPKPPAGPVTAESVSQIGPLAARRRSNLHYAMRVR